MSNTTNETEHAAYDSQRPSHEGIPETVASVDKIRDIIFGSQIKNYEARFVRLEENLVRETAELKDTMRKRFESIEAFFRSESEALAARLRTERDERESHIADLDRDMKASQSTLARRLNDIDAAMRDGNSALRQELMSESRKLLDEIGQHHDSIRSLMETRVSELRSQKTDRTLISDLFRGMAAQLAREEVSPSE